MLDVLLFTSLLIITKLTLKMYQEKRQKLQMGRCRQQNYLDSQTWFNTTLEKDQGPDCIRICLMRLSASAN